MTNFIRIFVSLVSAASLFSCTQKPKTAPDTLVVALAAAPSTLDPRFATDAGGTRVAGLLFSSLVRYDANLNLVGDAAESWEYRDKTYTFVLRKNLRFANGQEITAEDLNYTFQEYLSEKCPYRTALEPVEKFEVRLDSRERWVKLRLKEFNATFLSDLTGIKLLSKSATMKAGDDFSKVLIGSGPYKFVSSTSNQILLKARDDHPYFKPRLKNLLFKIVRDDDTRFLKVYKGEIDIVQSDLPFARIQTLEKKGDFNISKFPGLSMTYVLLNLQDPAFKDLRTRRAFAESIVREEIIKYKLEGLALPATSLLSPINPYFNRDLVPIQPSIENARRTFRELGVNTRELTLKTSNAATAIENGKVLTNQLRQVGLNVKQQSYEWGTFYGDIKKGNFQMAVMKWVGTIDPDLYRSAFHSHLTPENSGRNRGRYKNIALDRLVEDGLKIEDDRARVKHYQQIQKIVFSDLPIIPLWYENEVAVAHKRVKGYTPPKDGSFTAYIEVFKE